MVKLVLLLLIAGGLTVFAVQNLAPIALVVLGSQTPALPLSLWVLGALAAGGLTTLLLTGFSSLSKAGAVRRASQTRPSSDEAGAGRSPWGEAGTQRSAAGSSGAAGKAPPNRTAGFQSAASSRPGEPRPGEPRPGEDDWEREPRRDWDDWEASAPRSSEVRSPRPDRLDPPSFRQNAPSPSPTPRIRWEDLGRSGDRVQPPDRRSESEEQYREPQNRQPQNPPKRKDEVYDAEYRVLIPPYQSPSPSPDPPPPSVPPRSAPPDPTTRDNPEDEDWI